MATMPSWARKVARRSGCSANSAASCWQASTMGLSRALAAPPAPPPLPAGRSAVTSRRTCNKLLPHESHQSMVSADFMRRKHAEHGWTAFHAHLLEVQKCVELNS